MTNACFTFVHETDTYQVEGTYGTAQDQVFIVTKLLPDATRVLGVPGGCPSGLKIEWAKSAATRDELLAKLTLSFPALSNFSPC